MTVHAVLHRPTLGELVLVAGEDGLQQLTFTGQRHDRPIPEGSRADPGAAILRAATEQLDAYLAGELRTFDVPLAPRGTAFQQAVWAALRQIPFGASTSYGQLAACLQPPSAARAVGTAVGRNPVSIIVPCHRVLGASGALTGYAGGLERKRLLLELEGLLASPLNAAP